MKPVKYLENALLGVNELATKAKNTQPLYSISAQLIYILIKVIN